MHHGQKSAGQTCEPRHALSERSCSIHLPPQCLSLSKPDAGRMTAERRGVHGQTNTSMHTHAHTHNHWRKHLQKTTTSDCNDTGVDTCRKSTKLFVRLNLPHSRRHLGARQWFVATRSMCEQTSAPPLRTCFFCCRPNFSQPSLIKLDVTWCWANPLTLITFIWTHQRFYAWRCRCKRAVKACLRRNFLRSSSAYQGALRLTSACLCESRGFNYG